MDKKKVIDDFLSTLISQSATTVKVEGDEDPKAHLGKVMESFLVLCRKCGSSKVFVSWERGIDYGGMTGYSPGQKLFKCTECGNSASFYE